MTSSPGSIGCGMAAAELDVTEEQLPESLEPLLARMADLVEVLHTLHQVLNDRGT